MNTVQYLDVESFIGSDFSLYEINGPLLLWAAGDVSNPAIITALVERGGDINEVDGNFFGTPLTAAAADSMYPEILREIVRLGGDIHVRAQSENTALMTAAMYNFNDNIVETLVELGANINDVNEYNQTALDLAILAENTGVVRILEELTVIE